MVENLIWSVVFGIPFAAGWVAMSLTPPDFTITRICFITAALVVLGRIGWWISIEHQFENKSLIVVSVSLAFVAIGFCLGCGLYWVDKRESIAKQTVRDVFGLNFNVSFQTIRPNSVLVFLYPYEKERAMSFVDIALYIEAVNKKNIISRIMSYQCRALMEYDEGGYALLTTTPQGGTKYKYSPSGRKVEKWRVLHPMGCISSQSYLVMGDMSKARLIDFSKNSFDKIAEDKQLTPGESFSGWMFFEVEPDLIGQTPQVKSFEITLTNSVGESQTFVSNESPKEGKEEMAKYFTKNAKLELIDIVDLSKEHFIGRDFNNFSSVIDKLRREKLWLGIIDDRK